jgi:hypothetical protein
MNGMHSSNIGKDEKRIRRLKSCQVQEVQYRLLTLVDVVGRQVQKGS